MALLNRDDIKPAALASETHPCPSLGCDVVVRGALFSARLALEAKSSGSKIGVGELLPRLLAVAVVDAEGQPVLSEAEWDIHAGQHQADCMALFAVAMRLWGYDTEANRKN